MEQVWKIGNINTSMVNQLQLVVQTKYKMKVHLDQQYIYLTILKLVCAHKIVKHLKIILSYHKNHILE